MYNRRSAQQKGASCNETHAARHLGVVCGAWRRSADPGRVQPTHFIEKTDRPAPTRGAAPRSERSTPKKRTRTSARPHVRATSALCAACFSLFGQRLQRHARQLLELQCGGSTNQASPIQTGQREAANAPPSPPFLPRAPSSSAATRTHPRCLIAQ